MAEELDEEGDSGDERPANTYLGDKSRVQGYIGCCHVLKLCRTGTIETIIAEATHGNVDDSEKAVGGSSCSCT